MLKIFLGFLVFAAVAIWVLSKAGGSIDMGGEKHGIDAVHPPASAASQ